MEAPDAEFDRPRKERATTGAADQTAIGDVLQALLLRAEAGRGALLASLASNPAIVAAP